MVAGVSCQPFSMAGKMLGGDDPRAWGALLVCEAAVYVLLENVNSRVREQRQCAWRLDQDRGSFHSSRL